HDALPISGAWPRAVPTADLSKAFLVAESLSDTGTSATPTRADLVAEFANIQKQSSRLRAKEQHLLAELSQQARASAGGDSSRVRELAMRSLAAELGAVVRLSDRTIARRIALADTMAGQFPATVVALGRGEITWGHATTIADAGTPIDDVEARSEYELVVLERAASATPGRLRSFARVTAASIGKVDFQQR